MAEEKKNDAHVVEHQPQHEFSKELRVAKDENGKLYLTQAFCHNGHELITPDNEKFDGKPGIKLIGVNNRVEDEIVLSPYMNDLRKKSPTYKVGTIVDIKCPVCKESLPQLAPCGCVPGSFYRAIYLTKEGSFNHSIGICDSYGCPRAFIKDGGKIIAEVHAKSYEFLYLNSRS